MDRVKYLLIGGGVTAATAARHLREQDADGTIAIVSGENCVPYHRPPLSKSFLNGKRSREETYIRPESFYRERHIELLLGTTGTQLDLSARRAVLSDGRTLEFEKLLLATGGVPTRLPDAANPRSGIHYLRTLDDAAAIAQCARESKRAVIVGAGLVGMELAASLSQLQVDVVVIEALPRVLPRFAEETLSPHVQQCCEARGIRFCVGDSIERFYFGKDRLESVVTASGETILCDFACIGIGIRPNVGLAEQAGLKVDNGIVVDEFLCASEPGVYAGGDVANYMDPIFLKQRRVEHAAHAEYCGRLAARNMLGAQERFDLVPFVWSDVFDLRLQAGGDDSRYDETIIRGSFEERSLAILLLRANRLVAFYSLNADRKVTTALQNVIRARTNLAAIKPQLDSPAFSLADLDPAVVSKLG